MPLRATAAVCTTKGLRLRRLHKRPQTLIGVMFADVSVKQSVSMPDCVFARHGGGQRTAHAWRRVQA